jgi:Zn-dependent protease with chaperone function
MSIKQMLRAIRVGVRSRLFVCVLVVAAGYCFSFSHEPFVRLASAIGILVTSEAMIMLWGNAFVEVLITPFVKKGSISWQQIPVFTKFKALAEAEGVRLHKNKPFGLRKNFDNAYANPLTRQIVVGDKLLQRLGDGATTALVGHEITHLKRRHHIKMLLWTIAVPALLTFPLIVVGSPGIVYDIVFYAAFFMVFLFVSWHNEYDADAGAARIAGTKNTISLLKKIVPKGQWRHESETHPSVRSRILKLKRHSKK